MSPACLSGGGARRDSIALRAADGLAFAASPMFAFMACVAANDAPGMALCISGPDVLPIDGMTAMYLLMSLFHLSPWLKLASRRPTGRTPPITAGERP